MPQPVSYNPGTPVSGSIQENNISYVVDGQNRNYRGGFGGLSWMSEVPAENNVIFIGNSVSLGRGPANIPLFYPAYNTSQANIVYAANTLPGSPRNFTTSASAYNWAVTNNFFINNSDNPIPRINGDSLGLYIDANQPSSYPQTGTSWYDLSGRNNNGTLTNGPTWNSKGWFTFDGVDDYINFGTTSGGIGGSSEATMELLINMTFPQALQQIFGFRDNSGFDFFFLAFSGGGSEFRARNSAGTYYDLNPSISSYAGKWTQINFSVGPSGRRVYANGNLIDSSPTWTGNFGSTSPLSLGNYQIGNIWFATGDATNAKLYRKELSQAEILQNYYQAPIVTDGLVLAVDAGNLVSYESGSTTTYSLTGSISGSLINGVGYLPSYGGAWNFDSVDDRIFININLSISSSFTIEYAVLIKELPTAGEYNYIFLNGVGYQNNGVYAEFGSGYYSICTVNSSSAANSVVLSNPQANVVYYATATYENRTLKGYINGNLVSTSNLNFDPVNGSNNTLNIGAYGPFVIPFWRFYNKSLSAAEVQQNYEATKYKFQGQNIVTNGLAMYLDATNKDSYPGTGTTWYDLSGNSKNAAMSATNPPVFTTLNGIQCFQTSDLSNQNFYVNNYTFSTTGRTYELWINQSTVSIGYQTWTDDNLTERVLFGLYNDSFYIYPGLSQPSAISAGQWTYVAYTLSGDLGSTAIGYKNGTSIISGTYGYSLASGTGTLYLMGDSQGEGMSGYCALVRTYNRVLTPAEIQQNYNAQKTRFGL